MCDYLPMPMAKSMIVLLLFSWSSSLIDTSEWKRNYFNRKTWFEDVSIFQLDSPHFLNTFSQHRNVTEHLRWLNNEIVSLNRQIRLVKEQLAFIVHPRSQQASSPSNDRKRNASNFNRNHSKVNISSIPLNQRNIQIVKSLAYDPLFDGYIPQLIDLYRLSPIRTIECVAIIYDQKSRVQYLFIKTSNGDTDVYQLNQSKPLKKTFWKLNEAISNWNDADKHLLYYRRFIPERGTMSLTITDQLAEIKNRPKSTDAHFFDMMAPVLRIKYHVDPSSLSCILESFLGHIYTCEGRFVHPHELKLLSDDNDRFVFYAVMIDTRIERQIYPLGMNNRIIEGDQLYYLFQNHPQYGTPATTSCSNCIPFEQTFIINMDQNTVEVTVENTAPEPKPTTPVEPERSSVVVHSQNYIVYALVASLVVYVLCSIYRARQQEQEWLNSNASISHGKKHSISSRRTR